MARKQGNPPTIHIVEAGDTLFDIAQAYYGNGNLSTNISAANGNINPQNLQIGQRLQIPALGASSSNTGNVVVYDDSNYQGFSQVLSVGRYDWGQIRNDSISSLRVPAGMKVTFYSDTRFGGKSKTFTQDTPYVGDDFNDQASSIIVESTTVSPPPTNGYVVVYDDSNYRGFSQNLTLGRYDWGQIRNDSISSLRVPAGMKVTLYSDTRFGGKSKTFTQDTPYVGDDFNDQTSSIIVESSSSSGGGGKGFVNIVSRSSYESMFPNRNSLYSYDGLVSAIQRYPNFCNEGSDLQCKREAAAFLANIAHETGNLQYTEELNRANWPNYCDAANNTYRCVQGKTYHGRGPIQLSWNYNYGAFGQAIGRDLLNNPELVSTDSSIAFLSALWFWMTPQPPKPSCHNAINSYGFGMTINIINGGIECGKGQVTPQAQRRIELYQQFTRQLGVTPGENLSC